MSQIILFVINGKATKNLKIFDYGFGNDRSQSFSAWSYRGWYDGDG